MIALIPLPHHRCNLTQPHVPSSRSLPLALPLPLPPFPFLLFLPRGHSPLVLPPSPSLSPSYREGEQQKFLVDSRRELNAANLLVDDALGENLPGESEEVEELQRCHQEEQDKRRERRGGGAKKV